MAIIICATGYIILILSVILLFSTPPGQLAPALTEIGLIFGIGTTLTLLGYIGRIAIAIEEWAKK